MTSTDVAFTGSVPAIYDRYMGPMLFEPYADDMAARAASLQPRRILETAAGTGIVSLRLVRQLPDAELIVTDLNQAMLDVAAARLPPIVQLRTADAQALPFEDEGFDLVVCQFGMMFLPDRMAGYREARRVLKRGGHFLFNVWNRLDENPVSRIVSEKVAALFPDAPPTFFERVPFGYHDLARIEEELRAAGFDTIAAETVGKRSRAASPLEAATALCQGTPLRAEIEARDPVALPRATQAAAAALESLAGPDGIDAPMSAHVVIAA